MIGETLHASCVAIGDRAVLIFGPSGSGKSDLAMRLIDRGASLVSDDYTRIEADQGGLYASPPDTIRGKIELRGVGILTMPHVERVGVALLIDLALPPERLPELATRTVAGVDLPLVGLNGLEPSAAIKVEAALSLHGLPSPCP